MRRLRTLMSLVLVCVMSGCTGSTPDPATKTPIPGAMVIPVPGPVTVASARTVAQACLAASRALLSASPAVVITDQASLSRAVLAAAKANLPVLVVAAPADVSAVNTELRRLQTTDVYTFGAVTGLTGTTVHPGHDVLAEQSPQAQDTSLVVLTPGGPTDAALHATAASAGNPVVTIAGGDPRATAQTVAAAQEVKGRPVLAVGSQFGNQARLTDRLTTALAGQQHPGGGQLWFGDRRFVAMYGHPGSKRLGILGEQDVAASVARVRSLAAQYQPLSKERVIPMFEIIASVAIGSPGPAGTYSAAWPTSKFDPWVKAANANEISVVLDLQPGTAGLLDQAKQYESLLSHPNVGLALDPEWKLQPGQRPLQQIGQVDASEVNEVINWLAALTRRKRLPQKALVLHQFQTRMITHRDRLDLSHDELAVVIHADGQGGQGAKRGTWRALRAGAQPQLLWGWKNFYDEDTPTLTPAQTMLVTPTPVMISYQ